MLQSVLQDVLQDGVFGWIQPPLFANKLLLVITLHQVTYQLHVELTVNNAIQQDAINANLDLVYYLMEHAKHAQETVHHVMEQVSVQLVHLVISYHQINAHHAQQTAPSV